MMRHRKPKQFAEKVKEKLLPMFPPERLEAMAHQSRFVQRASSRLTGADFFALMTTDMLENPAVSLGGMCDLLQQRNPQAVLTPQALQQRLNAPQAVAYMQDVLQLTLCEQLAPLYAQIPATLLASFGRVFLEDSTQCCLHEKLAAAFHGSGGSASRSAVKIDVIYELLHHQLHALTVTDGRAADQGHAAILVPHLRAGDLVIRDLGYFSVEALQQITTKDAWFLSRLSSSVAVYASADASAPAVVFVDSVQQHTDQATMVELAVYLGPRRLPCRLVAYRLPGEVVEQRRRQAYETARKKRPHPDTGLSALVTVWVVYHQCQRSRLASRDSRDSVSDPVAHRIAVQTMEILITLACPEGDPARAHQMSPLWPFDYDYHVDADVFLCCVVCHSGLTPRNQFSEAHSVAQTQRTLRQRHRAGYHSGFMR